MKGRIFSISCAIAVMALAGCTDIASPVSSVTADDHHDNSSSLPVDQALNKMNPELKVGIDSAGIYQLSMVVGAGGMAGSPELLAMRSIDSVEFEMLSPEQQLIDFRTTDDIVSSGVMRNDGFASLTTTATVDWAPPTAVMAGSIAVMTIHTDKGVVQRSTALPADM
jgi:hypothetical protein